MKIYFFHDEITDERPRSVDLCFFYRLVCKVFINPSLCQRSSRRVYTLPAVNIKLGDKFNRLSFRIINYKLESGRK